MEYYANPQLYEVAKARIKVRKMIWKNIHPNSLRGVFLSSNPNYTVTGLTISEARELMKSTSEVLHRFDNFIEERFTCEDTASKAQCCFGVMEDIDNSQMFMNLVKEWSRYKGDTSISATFTRRTMGKNK